MDTLHQQLIGQVLATKLQNSELFTAFDISKGVKALGGTKRHLALRNEIHNQTKSLMVHPYDNYTQTLVTLPQGDAILYHPVNSDVNSYYALAGGSPPVTTAQTTGNPPASTTPDDGDDDEDEPVPVDKRGRFCIRSRLLRSLGFKPGDPVHAYAFPNGIVLERPDPNKHADGHYRVDKSCNVRVMPGVLAHAGRGKKCLAEIIANQLVVR